MPKEFRVYRDFSGGVNSRANSKDIKENELVSSKGIIGDEVGALRTTSPPTQVVGSLPSGDDIAEGRGIFTFKSDYSFATTAGDATLRSSQYIALCDSKTSEIDLYGYQDTSTNAVQITNGVFTLGSGSSCEAEFYYNDGALRVSDASFDAGNTTKWFGYIGGAANKKLFGLALDKEWISVPNDLPAPTRGIVGPIIDGDADTDSTTTAIEVVNEAGLSGSITVFASANSTHTTATSSSHGLSDGDIITITGTTSYNGEFTVSGKTANTFNIERVFVADDATGNWTRPANALNFQWATQIAAAAAGTQWYIAYDVTNADMYRITSSVDSTQILTTDTNGTGHWDAQAGGFEIYPFPGRGVVVQAVQSVGSTDGAWPRGEYEFSSTFIYEGNQESLVYVMTGTVEIDTNEVLYVRVHASGIESVSEFNTVDDAATGDVSRKRIIGGRVYTRKADSNGFWSLLLDMDFRTDDAGAGGGTRINTFSSYDSWAYARDADGGVSTSTNFTAANFIGLRSKQYTIKNPSPESFENLNGFPTSENAICFGSAAGYGYKTSVHAGSRVFVANVKYFNDSGSGSSSVMGDSIFYTPLNRLDTFPSSNRLDVQMLGSDGDEFTALAYADGLLFAFKNDYLYLVNVSSPQEAQWSFQGKHRDMGVHNKSAVQEVAGGVAWVNQTGLYIFAGGKLTNLSGGKISDTSWSSFIGANPVLGYDSSSAKLIIVDNSTKANGTVSEWKIFDLQTMSFYSGYDVAGHTNGWGIIKNTSGKASAISNMVTFKGNASDLNFLTSGGLIFLYDVNSTDATSDSQLGQLTLSTTGHSDFTVQTKDDDFGYPSNFKKIYEVDIEYLTDNGSDTIDVAYITNGDNAETEFISDQALSGNATMTNVNILNHKFTTPVKCRSFSIKIKNGTLATTVKLKILSISVRFRAIKSVLATETAGDS